MSRSKAEFRRALKVLPGGVNSPVRAFKGVNPDGGSALTPRFIERAQGSTLVDIDGRSYTDYIGSWGAMIVGHAHADVVQAVARTAADGLSFGTCSVLETELAEEIIDRVPGLEMVRFVNSGTEAVMSAVRLARAATGRELILKFEGNYHGHSDAMLAKAGSGVATLALPDSSGVPALSVQHTLVVPYNDLQAVQTIFSQHGKSIAAIVVEPIAGNMGLVPPKIGFLQGLRALCDAHKSILIFDEVMTGFRVARGGAQQLVGIRPDLSTFGKIIGGGLAVGAYAGSRSLMEMIAPVGPVYQAGTFSGNPVTMAAGLATLSLLDDAAYQHLEHLGARLQQGLTEALQQTQTRGIVQRVGSMISVFFGVDRVSNFAESKLSDQESFKWLFRGMLDRGIHLPPSGFESWFISLAHTDQTIEHTCRAARDTLSELKWATSPIGL